MTVLVNDSSPCLMSLTFLVIYCLNRQNILNNEYISGIVNDIKHGELSLTSEVNIRSR